MEKNDVNKNTSDAINNILIFNKKFNNLTNDKLQFLIKTINSNLNSLSEYEVKSLDILFLTLNNNKDISDRIIDNCLKIMDDGQIDLMDASYIIDLTICLANFFKNNSSIIDVNLDYNVIVNVIETIILIMVLPKYPVEKYQYIIDIVKKSLNLLKTQITSITNSCSCC